MGTGLSELGGALTWGEALLLLQSAAGDPSTHLGAELAGWAYPASQPELLTMIASIGDSKAAKKVMPWNVPRPDRAPRASDAEIAEAEAALLAGIKFS